MDKILVLYGASYGKAIDGLGQITTRVADFEENPTDFKMILFTGGEDVSPEFYNETSPEGMCCNSLIRDKREKEIYNTAKKYNILTAGICRGIQFLNVMAGGKMFHHVDNHAGTAHEINLISGIKIRVNSFHHQMIRLPKNGITIGWASKNLSIEYYGDKDEKIMGDSKEPEVAIFPEQKSFGVQYHPEMMPSNTDGYKFFWNMTNAALSLDWDDFIDIYTKKEENNNAIKNVKYFNNTTGQ